ENVAAALLALDPALLAVRGLIEGGDRLVESPCDVGSDRLGQAGLSEDHEVVASDVAREVMLRRVFLEDLENDRGQRLDHIVATQESVVVVVALEGVDVGIQHREALVLSPAPAD